MWLRNVSLRGVWLMEYMDRRLFNKGDCIPESANDACDDEARRWSKKASVDKRIHTVP